MTDWTPTETELPPVDTIVFLFDPIEGRPLFGSRGYDGEYSECPYPEWDGVKWDGDTERHRDLNITHWKPLPTPPKQ